MGHLGVFAASGDTDGVVGASLGLEAEPGGGGKSGLSLSGAGFAAALALRSASIRFIWLKNPSATNPIAMPVA